ncbi:MAG: hypothetical protein EA001_16600 [Oscillatoriales cyanobacterium]|nr:MAG: hypothetical protein EA001_16600 [Oscillatoriales cyanobacterium]
MGARGLGAVVIASRDAETVDFLYPNGRNKGLKPLSKPLVCVDQWGTQSINFGFSDILLGSVIISQNESEIIDFPCLNGRGRMLEHLAAHGLGRVASGF